MIVCPLCRKQTSEVWCAATDEEYFTTTESFTYYHCPSCDVLFIQPVPEDKLHQIYPPNYYSFIGRKKSLSVRIKEMLDKRLFKSILKKIPAEKINVLDVGGGNGWLLNTIRSIDSRVTFTQVVDFDAAAEQEALKNGHAYFNGKIEDFHSDQTFHLILMLNLIEHVADPALVISRVERSLAPGGWIILKTPNIKSWDARLFRKTYWGGLHCPRHWVLFSEKGFRTMISSSGLQVEQLKHTQGAPFWSWSVIIALHKMGWIKISADRPAIYHPLNPFLEIFFAAFDFARGFFVKTSQMFILLRKNY